MSEPLFTSEEGSTVPTPRMEAVSERAVHSASAAVEPPKGQGRSSGCLPLVLTAVIAAVVATVVSAAISTAVLFAGSHSGEMLGGSGRSIQQGDVVLGSGDKLEVYYPTPYEGVPNLQLQGGTNGNWAQSVQVEEQKPDHFTIKSKRVPNDPNPDRIHWRAEGAFKSK